MTTFSSSYKGLLDRKRDMVTDNNEPVAFYRLLEKSDLKLAHLQSFTASPSVFRKMQDGLREAAKFLSLLFQCVLVTIIRHMGPTQMKIFLRFQPTYLLFTSTVVAIRWPYLEYLIRNSFFVSPSLQV